MKQIIAVDALIVRDGRILLAKRAEGGLSPGCWSIPGGAIELGETVEDALVREIKEELNVELVSHKLWNAYSVMHEDFQVVALYYVGEVEGDFVVDSNEVTEVKWFELNEEILELDLAFNQRLVLKDFLESVERERIL